MVAVEFIVSGLSTPACGVGHAPDNADRSSSYSPRLGLVRRSAGQSGRISENTHGASHIGVCGKKVDDRTEICEQQGWQWPKLSTESMRGGVLAMSFHEAPLLARQSSIPYKT